MEPKKKKENEFALLSKKARPILLRRSLNKWWDGTENALRYTVETE